MQLSQDHQGWAASQPLCPTAGPQASLLQRQPSFGEAQAAPAQADVLHLLSLPSSPLPLYTVMCNSSLHSSCTASSFLRWARGVERSPKPPRAEPAWPRGLAQEMGAGNVSVGTVP